MPNLSITEIKAFVPAKDFEVSKQFYKDIGFTMASEGGGVAYFHFDDVSFLLQDYCAEGFAENFMMHILVKDADAWWEHIRNSGVIEKYAEAYGVAFSEVEMKPWRMKDFTLIDPAGVCWHIGQNVD